MDTKTIPFYTTDISINVESSNYIGFLYENITLEVFEKSCNGSRFTLTDMGEGRLNYKCVTSGDFIEGLEND